MEEQNKVRLLRAEEIECRAAAVSEKGMSLLLYKDARVDQRILDETFGLFGWQRSHQCIDGNLYCTVAIYDRESGIWVSKQDVGTVGYAEKEKSQASDSFKRACFNWGIGRELYTAPFIWIPAGKTDIRKKGERFYCNEHFSVADIGYNASREITSLTIVNSTGQTVYEMKAASGRKEGRKSGKSGLSKEQMDSLTAELERTGVGIQAVKERFRIEEPEAMPPELYEKVMSALRRTKPVSAA